MEEKIKSIEAKINAFAIQSRESLEQFRLQFISKKGEVTALFDELKSATAEQKRASDH